MSDDTKWAGNLTLDAALTPHGFQSLAAAVLSELRQHGKCYLYADEQGNILHKDPAKEIALVEPPALVLSPSAVVDFIEADNLAVVRVADLQLVEASGLVAQDTTEDKEL